MWGGKEGKRIQGLMSGNERTKGGGGRGVTGVLRLLVHPKVFLRGKRGHRMMVRPKKERSGGLLFVLLDLLLIQARKLILRRGEGW